MEVMLKSTNKIVTLVVNGAEVRARIWQGVTAAGIECHAFITRIAVDKSLDVSEFERDLTEHEAPRPDIQAIPLRLII